MHQSLTFQPSRLILGEPVPFGQRYAYPTSHALEVVMAPKYFDAARSRLRAGDTIRVVRLANQDYDAPTNWVMAYVDLMVMEVSAAGVKVAEERPAVSVPEPEMAPPAPEPEAERYIKADGAEVVKEDGGYTVKLGDERLAHLKSLAAAKAVAAGDAPLPR